MRNWQRLTLGLMFLGYAGYYFCRVNFSVATPLLIDAFGKQGLDKERIGAIVSLGTLCYAGGKFINGSLVDFLGGKRMFLFGMFGAICCTVLFGAGGLPFFTMAWALNRLVQSTGWAGLVRITSRWFGYSSYGAAMGFLSLSYLLGDVAWRWFLGTLIKEAHLGWQGIFYLSAGALAVIFGVSLLLLKESPQAIGEPEPPANPINLFGEAGHDEGRTTIPELLIPLLTSGLFWSICALSFGFTLVRETFGAWSPQYLHEALKMSEGDAAQWSAFFPLCGAASTLACGFLGDRLGLNGRAILILIGLVLAVPSLIALGMLHTTVPALIALGVVAVMILGPYSFLAGAIALDFGGKRGSATASGWIDGVGYVAGIFAGEGVGNIAQHHSWAMAFNVLAGITALSCIAAVVYLWLQAKRVH
jgi:OPA family glycerol-3-phosphate transporter-like MFS transporter